MSLPSWVRVGARVVCVDDSSRAGRVWMTLTRIVKGEIYTISGIAPYDPYDDEPCVLLAECPNSTFGEGDDGWFVGRFRPLITIEDDISTHFEALLHVPQLEDAQ